MGCVVPCPDGRPACRSAVIVNNQSSWSVISDWGHLPTGFELRLHSRFGLSAPVSTSGAGKGVKMKYSTEKMSRSAVDCHGVAL